MQKLLLTGMAILTLAFTGKEIVEASHYADRYDGRKAADGSTFRQNKLTAATNLYPLGTMLKIKNAEGDSVIVKVTDRLSPKYEHRIDLSKKAFKQLADLEQGIIKNIEIEQL